jgi:exopolyphosphatase/guanosine-5'-triphosphate,3'-diphosphate pyrophosphatase
VTVAAPTIDRDRLGSALRRGSRLHHRLRGQRHGSIGRHDAAAADLAATIVAAVDIGATSVHLLVAAWTDDGLVPLADDSVVLGLGRTVDAAGELGSARRTELVAALERHARMARRLGAESIAFVGTEPIRRAADAARAIAEVHLATGIRIEVLDHETEGFLTLLGVTRGTRHGRDLAVVDVGGGSSELVIARSGERPEALGLPIGAARLTQAVGPGNPPSWADLVGMRAVARERLTGAPRLGGLELLAVGGTASNLLKLSSGGDTAGCLARGDLERIIGRLVGRPSGLVARRFGVTRSRARLLPAGATILTALLDQVGLETLRVSHAGIREGLATALIRHGPDWRNGLPAQPGPAVGSPGQPSGAVEVAQ